MHAAEGGGHVVHIWAHVRKYFVHDDQGHKLHSNARFVSHGQDHGGHGHAHTVHEGQGQRRLSHASYSTC
jgi:hypothetical protein